MRTAIAFSVAISCLMTTPVRAQDLPPPDVINAIVQKLVGKGPPPKTEILFEPTSRVPAAGVCGLSPFDMRLTSNGATRNKYSVLIDSKPADGSSYTPTEFFAVLSRITVDADGAARAYHPEDPEGAGTCDVQVRNGRKIMKGLCALDKFSSGGTHIFRATERLSKDDLVNEWKLMWPMIRDRKLTSFDYRQAPILPKNFYLFYWRERNLTAVFRDTIITRDKAGYPCRHGQESDYPGYFVAATTLQHANTPARADGCKPASFIDAEEVPFLVLPKGGFGKVGIGDIAVARLKQNGNDRLVYGLIADAGPPHRLGEGSVAMNASLLGKGEQPVLNMRQAWALDIEGRAVAMLVLGGTRSQLNSNYSRANVEAVAKRAFERWGGGNPLARFDACIAQADVNLK